MPYIYSLTRMDVVLPYYRKRISAIIPLKAWLLFPEGRMKRLDKFFSLPSRDTSLKAIKIFIIIFPAIFVFCLVQLRDDVFGELTTVTWALSLFFIILAFSVSSFKLLSTIAGLQNRRRMRELTILNEIHQNLDDFHNLNAMLNRALDKLLQITKTDSGDLYLVDEQSNDLTHTLHRGIPENVFKKEIQSSLTDWVKDESPRINRQMLMGNLENFHGDVVDSLINSGFNSLAFIPLKSSRGTSGIVCLFSRNLDHFEPGEAKLLINVGNQIGIAIEKARLYEKVQAVAVLEERERISSELHDGLAQVLGYVITKSQATRQLLRKLITANEYLVELENVAQEVYTDTREAILGLRTAVSGNRSMVSALREYASRFNQMHNIRTEISVGDRIIPSLPPQIELQVIRIVQEALSNIRKHAEATRAMIKVAATDDDVTVTVEDDGKGFNVYAKNEGDWTKFGLRNMKDRAESIHANLSIKSRPEYGTTITLRIPSASSQESVNMDDEIESTDSR